MFDFNSMQYTDIFSAVKIKNFIRRILMFLYFCLKYRSWVHVGTASMFWCKNYNNRYTPPCVTQFYYIKVGYKGVFIARFPGEVL